MMPKPIHIQLSISLNEEVKLRESENPWKPGRQADTSQLNEGEKETDVSIGG